jgi:hypothetical protein
MTNNNRFLVISFLCCCCLQIVLAEDNFKPSPRLTFLDQINNAISYTTRLIPTRVSPNGLSPTRFSPTMEELKAPNHVKTRDPLEKKSDEPAITMTVGQTMTFGSRLNNSPNRIHVQAPENEDNIVEDNGILTMIQEHKDNQVNDRTFMDHIYKFILVDDKNQPYALDLGPKYIPLSTTWKKQRSPPSPTTQPPQRRTQHPPPPPPQPPMPPIPPKRLLRHMMKKTKIPKWSFRQLAMRNQH